MQATIVITYRTSEGSHRRDNLFATLGCLAQLPEHEVIVVEQDAVRHLTEDLPYARCRTVFAYNPGPFNKSWGFNLGARMAQGQVLVFGDSDIILSPGLLQKGIVDCFRGYHVAKPYRTIINLTPEQTAHMHLGQYDYLPSTSNDADSHAAVGEQVIICGGVFVIRAATLRRMGGWDERFRGWGKEDDAMTYRVQRARLPTVEYDERPALHLWHPRTSDGTHDQPYYRDNCELLRQYHQYSEAEFNRFAEVNRQVIGNQYKYQQKPEKGSVDY